MRGGMAEPGFFMPWAAARNCIQRMARIRGEAFSLVLNGQYDRDNAHNSHSGDQRGRIMRVIAGNISRLGRRPFMSVLTRHGEGNRALNGPGHVIDPDN
jgi:hypothetical protein